MNSESDEKSLAGSIKLLGICVVLQSIFVLIAVFLVVNYHKKDSQIPGVTQEANPSITTNVNPADQSEAILARAQRRGYFTRSEFSELMDFSERTLDRRIEEGRLSPPPFKDTAGNVVIDLDTVILDND